MKKVLKIILIVLVIIVIILVCFLLFLGKRHLKLKEIENKFDMHVQVNAIKFLNELLDEKIIALS